MNVTSLEKLKATLVLTIEDLFKHDVLVGVTFSERGIVTSWSSPYKVHRLSDKNEKGEEENGVVITMYNTMMLHDDRHIVSTGEVEVFMSPAEHGVGITQKPTHTTKLVFGMKKENYSHFDDNISYFLYSTEIRNQKEIIEELNTTAWFLGLPKRAPIF